MFARLAGPQPPEFDAKLLKKNGDDDHGRQRGASRRPSSPASNGAEWIVSSVDDQGAQAQRGAAVHHEQAAADGALPGQEDDDARAAALRGRHRDSRADRRPHHLHANRLGARGGRGARRGARAHQDDVRRRLPAREAERLQDEVRRAGRARGDSADLAAARSGNGQAVPDAGSVLALPADLEPLRRVADAAGDVRRDDRRRHGGRLPVPRQGHGAEVRRLDGHLRPDAGRDRAEGTSPAAGRRRRRRRRRRGVGRAAAARRRRSARAEGAAARAEVHAAAAAVLRGDARQGARGERHRPAEHLRVDHRRAAGSRVRQQDRRAVQAVGARRDDHATC